MLCFPEFSCLSGWILWPALAIMMAESILSISSVAVSTLCAPRRQRPKRSASFADDADGPEEEHDEQEEDYDEGKGKGEEADPRIVIGGVLLSCVSCVVLVAVVFGEEGIKWWATVIALGLASTFSILGCAFVSSPVSVLGLTLPCIRHSVQALGETDLNP